MAHRLYLSLLLLLSGISAWFPLAPFADFWAHAAVGRWIFENNRVPHEALFLWSTSQPWVAHSWLSQLLFYIVMRLGGETGGPTLVLLFTMLLVMLTFGLLWLLWSQRARVTVLTPFLFALAVNGSRDRFGTRPELFTAVFLACLFLFLTNWPREDDNASEGEKKKNRWSTLAVPALIVMFALWANLHGAVIVGLIVLAATIICDLAQFRQSASGKRLVGIGVLCALAACLNPYGLKYWTALQSVQSFTFSLLEEWKPPFSTPVLAPDMIGNAAVLLLIALVAWGMNPQRRWAQLAWLVIIGALFLQARRNLWLFNLTSLAVIAANAQLLDTRRLWQEFQQKRAVEQQPVPQPRHKKHRDEQPIEPTVYEVPSQLRRLAQVLVVGSFLLWIGLKVSEVWPIQPLSRHLPDSKIQFIKDRNLQGRAFNSIEDSPYLEWQGHAKLPLFIDILNAYPDDVTRDYIEIIQATPRGQSLLKSHDVKYVIFASSGTGQTPPPLMLHLEGEAGWKTIYNNYDGMIWERQSQ